MVKPEDVAQALPEMDTLGKKEEEAITKLLEAIRDTYKDELPALLLREETEERKRLLAYKFLKARKWKHKDALEMFTSTVTYRAEQKLDSTPLFPCAFPLIGFNVEEIKEVIKGIPSTSMAERAADINDACYRALQTSYVNVYHYCDKEGHPVLYDCFGQANVQGILREMTKITPVGKAMEDVIVPYHTYMNEIEYYMIRYADVVSQKVGGRPIMGVTVIINAEGMHFGMLQTRFIKVVRSLFEVDQKYYPEVMHRLFIVNCPGMLITAFKLVKGSLDVNTQRKITFCSKAESLEVLKRIIDEDKIPEVLGGKCHCEGGCLPRYVAPDSGADGAAAAEVETEEVSISAGKHFTKTFDVAAGDEVNWEFAVDGTDIQFTVAFEPTSKSEATSLSSSMASAAAKPHSAAGEGKKEKSKKSKKKGGAGSNKEQQVIKQEKLSLDVESYVATGPGKVLLTWDNGYSWMHAKHVQLRASVIAKKAA